MEQKSMGKRHDYKIQRVSLGPVEPWIALSNFSPNLSGPKLLYFTIFTLYFAPQKILLHLRSQSSFSDIANTTAASF